MSRKSDFRFFKNKNKASGIDPGAGKIIMANKNGKSKIEKWLESRGYYMTYVCTDQYRYHDGFHSGELYSIDTYRTSLGYYVKIKPYGKPRYYLCEHRGILRPISAWGIGFSQAQFIKQIERYFPQNNSSLE